MRRAKIVCTLGPATSSPDQLRELVAAGMDVARFNLSHGDLADHERVYLDVRKASDEAGHAVGILADLQGPKIRTGRFRDGSVVRFTGQASTFSEASAPWGPLRIVYLQYASDPITFFEPGAAFRVPAWLRAPLGPDVSPELRWYPLITFLQLGLDMALATTTPMGHGHVYAPEHYIDAWIEVTEPAGWTRDQVDALKRRLRER